MNNEEKILSILSTMQGAITAMQGDIASMKEDISQLNVRVDRLETKVDHIQEDLTDLMEEHSVTRGSVNRLVEWSESAGYIIHFPLDQAK